MRTTVDDVRAIISTTLEDATITNIIGSASTLLDSLTDMSGLSVALLTEIERWMSAHMIAITWERTAKNEGAGGASIEYAGNFGTGFASTQYGQMAITLDTTGTLKTLDVDGEKRASVYIVDRGY